jgi:phytanoyl-CoA hydroxylase
MNTQQLSAQQYYETQGYFVYRNLIPTELINELTTRYQNEILPSKYPFFRQDTNKYEPNQINEFGYVEQAFLDIHDYQQFPAFSTAAKNIFCSQLMQTALREITGFESFNLMQTMLFDANTETTPHQDWWYLDSVPNGHLLGAWIALEDIDERAGRFYVIPESIEVDLHSDTPDLPWLEWKQRMQAYLDSHADQIKAPELKRGDVLFWNSRTIHGALLTTDPSFSRKSLTAHYLPSTLAFGNLFTKKDFVKYKTYQGVKFYRNQPDYSLINQIKSGIKVAIYSQPKLMKTVRKLQAQVLSR